MMSKISSFVRNSVDGLFKFFSDSYDKKVYLSEHVPLEFVFLLDLCLNEEYEVIYTTDLDKCPICGGKIWKNSLEPLLVNKIRKINRQKFKCSNLSCDYSHTTNLEYNIDKGCNYTINTREKGLDMGLIFYMSYEKMAEIYEAYTGISMPRSTVYYHQKELKDEYLDEIERKVDERIKKLGIEPSGVYCYDEQVFWVEGMIYLRMTILDAETELIINEKVISGEDFNKNTIKRFLKELLDGIKIKAIVTDGYQSYPSISEALGAIHPAVCLSQNAKSHG